MAKTAGGHSERRREYPRAVHEPQSPGSAGLPQRADRGQFAGLRPPCDGLGSTRNIVATSAGVNSGSASVYVRTCVWPLPGPVLRSCVLGIAGAPWGACRGCRIWPTGTILPSPAVTCRPPGAKFLVPGCPVTPPITVTQGDSSGDHCCIAAYSGNTVGKSLACAPGSSSPARIRRRATGCRVRIHGDGELALAPGRSVRCGGPALALAQVGTASACSTMSESDRRGPDPARPCVGRPPG